MIKVILVCLLMLVCNGCVYLVAYEHKVMMDEYKSTCNSLGFQTDSNEFVNCVLDLRQPRYNSVKNQIMNNIGMTHTEMQILNHGAGGCTPNFATGGCL